MIYNRRYLKVVRNFAERVGISQIRRHCLSRAEPIHTPMLLSNLEYVPLRLVRRFLFTERFLARLGRFLPYYRTNQGQMSPAPIVDAYEAFLARKGLSLDGRRVLEIGCGVANGTGYEMAGRFGARWTGLEPYAAFDAELDARIREDVASRHPAPWSGSAVRTASFDPLPDASFDLILSNSVLEHVFELAGLLRECSRVLAPGGAMLHRVDYRDHFFKYPFHFLQFSEKTWRRLVGPGDLTRRRLPEHLALFAEATFTAEALEITRDPEAFDRMRKHLHPAFRRFDREELAVTGASVFAVKKK